MTIPNQAKALKNKICLLCNLEFSPTGRNSKYCTSCAKVHWKSKSAQYQQNYRIRNGIIKNPGVGSGNASGSGKSHHSYKNGLGCDFQDVRRKIKEERRYCENKECGKDLINATRYHWCLHHIDHNRTNNTPSNFQLLCKRCHQVEHDCIKAFEGVTTIRKE